MNHPVEWLAPAPLWDLALEDTGNRRFREPAILRYASDGFFDELTADVAGAGAAPSASSGLAARVARPETWERPAAGWVPATDGSLAGPVKLFQPAHQRYYLLAASLVCRRAGMPERKVDAAAAERAAVVVRRLVPKPGVGFDPEDPATYTEHGWVGDRRAGKWEPVGADPAPLAGEERLTLFSLPYRDAAGQPRRLHAALLPVAGRELYEGASPGPAALELPPTTGDDLAPLADPRKAAWASGPFIALRDLADGTPPADLTDPIARDLLRFALLDLADLIKAELPQVWAALVAGSSAGLAGAQAQVYALLDAAFPWGDRWRLAVVRADARRQALLAGTDTVSGTPVVPGSALLTQIRPAAAGLIGAGFQSVLYAALDSETEPNPDVPSPAAAAPLAAAKAASAAASSGELDGAFYRARCVYERPRCAQFSPPVVSAPSRPFRLAAFFDPDAPARPLTIRLPLDTSIKGLKRFPKGVSMLLSNKLRQQVERVQGAKLEDIDNGDIPGPEPSWSLGMICSFSIPIITLCAFIVLMIFIILLNIVFWWLPFLKICLPIPVRSE